MAQTAVRSVDQTVDAVMEAYEARFGPPVSSDQITRDGLPDGGRATIERNLRRIAGRALGGSGVTYCSAPAGSPTRNLAQILLDMDLVAAGVFINRHTGGRTVVYSTSEESVDRQLAASIRIDPERLLPGDEIG